MSDHYILKQENSVMGEMSPPSLQMPIKNEPQDLGELKDSDFDNENYKEETNYSQNQIDQKNEPFENEIENGEMELEEDKPLKRKKKKKNLTRYLPHVDGAPKPSDSLLDSYYDFELSVEFLSQLFQYVNELCEFINEGDQNVSRSSIVIQHLNDSVKPYRANLPDPKDNVVKDNEDPEDFKEDFKEHFKEDEDFKYEMDLPDYFENQGN